MRIFADNPHPVAYLRITVGFIARLLVLSQHKAPIESPDTMVLSYITVLKGEKKEKLSNSARGLQGKKSLLPSPQL